MTRPWEADAELSPEQSTRLIAAQIPSLAPARVEIMGVGWDNAAFVVNERYVFRFPRRQVAAGLIEREARILPLLAPHVPLPIPVPEFVGHPDDGYPYYFAGYPMLPGTTADRKTWTDEDRAACAVPVVLLLCVLHSFRVDD